MISIGHFSLVCAFFLSMYGLIAGIWGAKNNNLKVSFSAANAVFLMGFLLILSLASLIFAFISHDYSNLYVWQHSSNDMHPLYLVGAVWGGMDGSMLLWAAIMGLFASIIVSRNDDVPRKLFTWVVPMLSGACFFFLFVVTFLTNPFRLIPEGIVHMDGNGLNPLLQNPSMMIHPPLLYLGFTGFVVPFAFCMAALASGDLSTTWIRLTRKWTLIAWIFLTSGIILGGNWAYIELGWGGFWAWDPVENASFMPWLTGTAFLHSVMVQEHRGMLKVWNVMLAVLTYLLTVFGTFLTRSGIVQSVHAFAETEVGWVFLVYMGFATILALCLVFYRWSDLKPDNYLQSYFSREAAFLFNNLCFLGILITTIWGVLLPVITEAFTGEKSVVGPPFFNRVNGPLFLLLLFLMAVGPLISWRRTTLKQLRKVFLIPVIISFFILLLGIWLDHSNPYAAISFALSSLVVITIFNEFHRATRIRSEISDKPSILEVGNLLKNKPRKYGAHIIHLAVALAAVSITAATVYKTERDIALSKDVPVEVGSYALVLKNLTNHKGYGYDALRANVLILDKNSGKELGYLYPEKRFYIRSEEVTTEVDIRTTLKEDLYLALATTEGGSDNTFENTKAILKVFINPLQVWLWFSSILMLFGSFVLLGEYFWNKSYVTAKSRTSRLSESSSY